MSVTLSSRLIGPLMALAICALPASGWGQTPARAPLYLLEIKRGEVSDPTAAAVVRQRLQQMGETVLSLPEGVPPASCEDGKCVLQRARGVPELARLLGGSADGQLFFVDAAKDKILTRSWNCSGDCDAEAALAREAGLLVERAARADSGPGCVPAPAAPRKADASFESGPLRSALQGGVSLQLAAKKGLHVPTRQLALELQRSLLEMGLPVTTQPGARAGDPTGAAPAELAIELAPEPGKAQTSEVHTVLMTLKAAGGQRQLSFYCSKESCQGSLLSQLRLNLGLLLDDGGPAGQPALADADLQLPCGEPPVVAGAEQASRKPVLPQAPAAIVQAAVLSGPTDAQNKCRGPRRPALIAMASVGGVLTVAGLAGLSAGLARIAARCTVRFDGVDQDVPCDSPGSAPGIAAGVGAAGIAVGAVLLGYSIHGLRKHSLGCAP